jgi:tetratricopeptide (TPR) repeat protein
MRPIIFLLICIGSAPHIKSVAQSEIDSLRQLVKATPDSPEKIDLYARIAWLYAITHHHLDEAKAYADSIRILGERLDDPSATPRSHFYYGLAGRFEGKYREALKHLDQFMQYYTAVGDSNKVAGGLYQIGVINHDLGNYEKSLAAYHRVIGIRHQQGDDYGIGYTLNAIGVIQKKMNRFDHALRSYKQALSIFDDLQADSDRAVTLTNIANLYASRRHYDSARHYYRRSLQINKEIGELDGQAYDLENMGNMLNLMHRYDSALSYHLQSLSIRQKFPQQEALATSLNAVGYTYLQLKNYDEASAYFETSLTVAKGIQAKPLLRDIYQNLSQLHYDRKNFESAYGYQRLFYALKDSILNETSAKQLSELQVKYETAEKDNEIALLEKEKEVQMKETARQATLKRATAGGLALVVLLSLLTIYIFRQRLKNQKIVAGKNEEIKEINFKHQLRELEMKALRAQINPHFFFNCMNSINRMILNGDTENASRYLAKFSKLVRIILENAETAKVSLDNELALLESYIQLEELRFKGKIDYKISVDESIEQENTYLPSMVLQPFVENAIWHGLMHRDNNGKGIIHIDIKEQDDRLLCTIEDNGVGRQKAQELRDKSVLKNKSMGMKITEERLRLLSREQLDKLISITDLKDALNHALGTRVEINIPIS